MVKSKDMARGKNIYLKKLSITFAAATIAISIILLLSAMLLIRNLSISRDHAVISGADAQSFNASLTFEFIGSAIDRLSTSRQLQDWLESKPGSPDYYQSSLLLFKQMKTSSPSIGNLVYEISITAPDQNSFVITPEGTISKELFISQSGIQDSQFASFMQGIYPVYGNSGAISDFVMVLNRSINGNSFIIFARFPALSVYSSTDYLDMALFDGNRNVILSNSPKLKEMILKTPRIVESSGNLKEGKTNFSITQFPDINITLIYGFDSRYTQASAMIMVLLAIAIVSLSAASYHMTNTLYKPVKEAVNHLNTDNAPVTDEFNLILDNCRKIEQLNMDLEEARNEQRMLSEQQKYRAFLRGVPTKMAGNDSSSFFSLCTASLAENDVNSDTLFARLDILCKEQDHLHSIRTAMGECVIIQKADNMDQAYCLLIELIKKSIVLFENTAGICFAIADTVKGYMNIPTAYKESQKILGYRYKIRNKVILTTNDMNDVKTLMYYPLSEEGRLMNALLSNDMEALNIFDSIMENNIGPNKNLPSEELERLTFSVTSSAMRFFQELKEDPEELIGEKIDWSGLYESTNYIGTLKKIRDIFEKACLAGRIKEEEDYDNIINKMKDYIAAHFSENIMLIDLSNEFNLTPKYCSQIFKKLSNDTFKNYLNQYRIDEARKKIQENPDIKISDLSNEVGFTSSTTFIRVFSKYVGTTPKSFAEIIRKRGDCNE